MVIFCLARLFLKSSLKRFLGHPAPKLTLRAASSFLNGEQVQGAGHNVTTAVTEHFGESAQKCLSCRGEGAGKRHKLLQIVKLKRREGVPEMGTKPVKALRGYRLGQPSLQNVFVKFLVKFDLEFDLKFEISDGKIW